MWVFIQWKVKVRPKYVPELQAVAFFVLIQLEENILHPS